MLPLLLRLGILPLLLPPPLVDLLPLLLPPVTPPPPPPLHPSATWYVFSSLLDPT